MASVAVTARVPAALSSSHDLDIGLPLLLVGFEEFSRVGLVCLPACLPACLSSLTGDIPHPTPGSLFPSVRILYVRHLYLAKGSPLLKQFNFPPMFYEGF